MEIAFERGERKKRGGYGHALPRFSCIFGKIRIFANRRLKFLSRIIALTRFLHRKLKTEPFKRKLVCSLAGDSPLEGASEAIA